MKQVYIKNNIQNILTKNGNKQNSEKTFLKSLKYIQKTEINKNSTEVFKNSLVNASPSLFLKNIKRKRKQTIEFPFILPKNLKLSYGIKVILSNCLSKSQMPLYKQLKQEVINSSKKTSKSVLKKNQLHKESFLKKKFANYRWF